MEGFDPVRAVRRRQSRNGLHRALVALGPVLAVALATVAVAATIPLDPPALRCGLTER